MTAVAAERNRRISMILSLVFILTSTQLSYRYAAHAKSSKMNR
jgi:hypothetical protein